jgi:hypothetical protein
MSRRRKVPPTAKAWTPAKVDYGLVVAVVGAVIALLIIGTLAYTQRIVDVTTYLTPLAGSLATVLSAVFVVVLARHGFGTVTIVIATIIVTVALAGVALAGVWWLQTQPGRSAARTASDWRLVYQNTFTPDKPCEISAENLYGSGKVCISGGVLTDWLHSNQTADQPALDQGPTVSGQWYARVDMRLLQGPPDAVCMLMFGYRDPNHWYALRVQGQQPGSQAGSAGVSEFEGAYPGRFYSGPTVERSIDLSSWTSAAIEADGKSHVFLINNRVVGHVEIDNVQGGINIGTLAPGSNYRTTEACQFRDLIVRQR